MSLIKQILDWDEARDPTRGPDKKPLPWSKLNLKERQLLDAVSDGTWIHESALRGFLRWGRLRFLWTTVRLLLLGWLEARPQSSMIGGSEFRLNPSVWE